jgi:membrane protease YdiL (CAAX protease family)
MTAPSAFALDLLFAFVLALGVALLLVGPARRRAAGPWSGFWFFFLISFMLVWAAGAWVAGPLGVAWGGTFLVFLLVAVVVSLFFVSVMPPVQEAVPAEPPAEPPTAEEATAVAMGIFFWILLFILLILAIFGTLQAVA